MNLKEFVSEVITSVLERVAEAQKGQHGSLVGPTFRFKMKQSEDMLGVLVHGSKNYTEPTMKCISSTLGVGFGRRLHNSASMRALPQ
jgi:hypothetical protein